MELEVDVFYFFRGYLYDEALGNHFIEWNIFKPSFSYSNTFFGKMSRYGVNMFMLGYFEIQMNCEFYSKLTGST